MEDHRRDPWGFPYHLRTATRFWGEAGAGAQIVCSTTGRILLGLRSPMVNEPGTWGGWGGAIDYGESPREGMEREIEEEAGLVGPHTVEPLWTFVKGSFKYYNFLVVVPREFKPRLSWETSRAAWFDLDDLPSPLHFGFKAVFPHLMEALPEFDAAPSEGFVTSDDILELEDRWAGGIADFGDPKAAYVLRGLHEYPQYQRSVVAELVAKYGRRWRVFRAMTESEVDAYRTMDVAMEPKGWTFRRDVALSWSRLAQNQEPRFVVAGIVSNPDAAVWMRGKAEESEVVLSMDEVDVDLPDTLPIEKVSSGVRCTEATLRAFGIEGICPIHGTGVLSALREAGYRCVFDLDAGGTKLRDYVRDHPTGAHVVSTPGHSMALIDGRLVDTANLTGRGKVDYAFEVTWPGGGAPPYRRAKVASAPPAIRRAILDSTARLDPDIAWAVETFSRGVLVGVAPALERYVDALYPAFEPLRDALHSRYGSTLHVFRGEPVDRPAIKRRFLSWTTDGEMAAGFADRRGFQVVEADVAVADIVAGLVSEHNPNYIEYLVRDRPSYHERGRLVPETKYLEFDDDTERRAVETFVRSVGGRVESISVNGEAILHAPRGTVVPDEFEPYEIDDGWGVTYRGDDGQRRLESFVRSVGGRLESLFFLGVVVALVPGGTVVPGGIVDTLPDNLLHRPDAFGRVGRAVYPPRRGGTLP